MLWLLVIGGEVMTAVLPYVFMAVVGGGGGGTAAGDGPAKNSAWPKDEIRRLSMGRCLRFLRTKSRATRPIAAAATTPTTIPATPPDDIGDEESLAAVSDAVSIADDNGDDAVVVVVVVGNKSELGNVDDVVVVGSGNAITLCVGLLAKDSDDDDDGWTLADGSNAKTWIPSLFKGGSSGLTRWFDGGRRFFGSCRRRRSGNWGRVNNAFVNDGTGLKWAKCYWVHWLVNVHVSCESTSCNDGERKREKESERGKEKETLWKERNNWVG